MFQDPVVDDENMEEYMCRMDLLLSTAQGWSAETTSWAARRELTRWGMSLGRVLCMESLLHSVALIGYENEQRIE
jgi:hypothetical protein